MAKKSREQRRQEKQAMRQQAMSQPSSDRTNRTPEKDPPGWEPRFLTALAKTGNVSDAAATAGIGRRTAYDRREADQAFAAAWEESLDTATDSLELEARRRAHDGLDKPIIYQGELMGVWIDKAGNVVSKDTAGARQVPLTVKEYSDTLLIFLLKAHRPDKYRENVRHEHAGDGGGPIRHKHDHQHRISLEDFEKLSVADKMRTIREMAHSNGHNGS